MSLFSFIRKKQKTTGAIVGLVAVSAVLAGVLPSVFASTAYYMPDVLVELDGTNDATMTVSFNTPEEDTFANVRGNFDTSVGYDAQHTYFTLTGMSVGGDFASSSIANNTVADGLISWMDWTNPAHVGERSELLSATYTVDKDTPAGDHAVCLRNIWIASDNGDWDTLNINSVCVNITVTRSDTSATKPSQVVTFTDADDNPITEITKYYGDDDFEIKKSVTTGDGAIVEYHPDDDGTGRIAHTVPGGDWVGVGEPGDVDICARVEGTVNYAETTACYTVHVLKRPLDIVGVTIAPKTYDGTDAATVTSVSFEDKGLNNDQYTATARFDDVDAGENIALHVSVILTGGAEDNYVLNASNYNTTATIAPFHLVAENVSLPNGNTYTYNPDGVEPAVRVEANTHGGLSTLVEGTDYTVSYSNNVNVGSEAHVTVTGINNYTTGDVPVVLDFTIEQKGINNSNLIIPSSVVEGHIVTADEIRMNVDGHDLVRCENDGDTDCDYVLTISGNTGILNDQVHIAIDGRNNYTGVATGDINIVEKLEQTVSFGDVTNTTVAKVYGDSGFKHEAQTNGDGNISYSSSDEAVVTVNENGDVTIVGVGEADIIATASETATYAQGSAKYTVSVAKKTLSIVGVTVDNKVYDGTAGATVSAAVLSDNGLAFGTDYSVSDAHFPSANAGSYGNVYVAITLSGSVTDRYQFDTSGATSASFNGSAMISQFELTADNSTVALNTTEYSYNGEARTPTATVKVDLDGDGTKETTLVAGTDYSMNYNNNINAGIATATVSAQGNYGSTIEGLEFTIARAEVSDVSVTAASQTYTGEALEPVPTVTGTVNGESVTFTSDDYVVADHEDFIGAGDKTFTISSREGSNYNIPATNGTFTINKAASGEPAEFSADLKIEAGKTLADLGEMSEGLSWVDATEVVTVGEGHYSATYVKNGDTANYETTNLSLTVYGLTRISVTIVEMDGGSVTGSGASALEGDELSFTFVPDEGYELRMVTLNGEDYTNKVSGNKLSVTAGADDLMLIAYFRHSYEVVKGAGQTHIIGVDGVALFEIDADYELFEEEGAVYVDNELVSPENYESWSSSTVIQFTKEYMDSLSVGEHALAVEFSDGGIARASFIVAEPEEEAVGPADTGVFTGMMGGATVTGASVFALTILASLAYAAAKRKK